MLFVAVCVMTQGFAQAPAPGLSVVVKPAENDAYTGVNASISGKDGTTLWFASEYVDPDATLSPGLYIWRETIAPRYTAGNEIQATSELTDDGMYPSIFASPTTDEVWVVGKEDVLQSDAHMRIFRQQSFNFPIIGPDWQAVTSPTDGVEHSKPDFAFDALLDDQYLCWKITVCRPSTIKARGMRRITSRTLRPTSSGSS